MSSDGYFASAVPGPDAKIYVWSLDAALERARSLGDDTASKTKLKGRAVPARDISIAPRQQSNNRGLARYGNDFWGDDTNCTPRRSEDTSSSPRLRNFFGSLRSSTRSANTPSIQHQPRRLNFSSFPVTISRRPITVAPCREEDRYRITPETDAEAAAAMQRTNSNNVNSSTAQGQAATGTQRPHGQPTQSAQGQSSDFGAGEPLIGCCGFYLVRRRPASN